MNSQRALLFGGAMLSAGIAGGAEAQSFNNSGGVVWDANAYDYANGSYVYAYSGAYPFFTPAGGASFTAPDGSTSSATWDGPAGTWHVEARQNPAVVPPTSYVRGEVISTFTLDEDARLTIVWDFADAVLDTPRSRWYWELRNVTPGDLKLLDAYNIDAEFVMTAAQLLDLEGSFYYDLDASKTYQLVLHTDTKDEQFGHTEAAGASIDAGLSEIPPLTPSTNVITPVGAVAPAGAFGSDISHTFDGSGLGAGPILEAVHAQTAPPNCYVRPNFFEGDPFQADFDLGGQYMVDGVAFWNMNVGPNEFGNSGLRNVALYTSTDGVNYERLPGSPVFFEETLGTSSPVQIYHWVPVSATHVRLVALTNHGDNFENRAFGEIRFLGDADVSCTADWDANGMVNADDLQGFTDAFNAQESAADLNSDGVFDFTDYAEFLNELDAGC